jgi:hypothetical protein
MAGATRRTHIVRVSDAKGEELSKESNYFDIEVLDAIAFRTDNGKEMVLDLNTEKAVPYIVDETGGDHGKSPGNATRRSHMKRIVSGDAKIDVEVLDAVSFRDKNGEEWILNLPGESATPYNVDEPSGGNSTRRTHNEKIYTSKDDKGSYITVERSDMMAFRTINGKEMIIKMESHDDGKGKGRAETHVVSPEGYDPDNDDGPEPPKNEDPHNYIKFVKNVGNIVTKKEKIAQGPLWWIRKVHVAQGEWIRITASAMSAPDNKPQTWMWLSMPKAFLDDFHIGNTMQIMAHNEGPDGSAPPIGDALETSYFGFDNYPDYKRGQPRLIEEDDLKKTRIAYSYDSAVEFDCFGFQMGDGEFIDQSQAVTVTFIKPRANGTQKDEGGDEQSVFEFDVTIWLNGPGGDVSAGVTVDTFKKGAVRAGKDPFFDLQPYDSWSIDISNRTSTGNGVFDRGVHFYVNPKTNIVTFDLEHSNEPQSSSHVHNEDAEA